MRNIAYIRSSNIYDDSRATKEICTLAEAGYKIFVLGWNRDGSAETNCKAVFEQYKNLITCFFYCMPAEKGIGIKHINKLLGWFKWTYSKLNELGVLDAVHACNLDAGISAFKYCKKYKVKLVYDIYDYYIDSHSIPKLLIPIIEAKEIRIINRASTTIICTEERRKQICKARPRDIVVIYNSPNILKVNEKMLDDIDYVYCGALNKHRLIDEIIEKYSENDDLKMVFAGYGECCDTVKEASVQFKNFEFKGALQYKEVLTLEAKSMALAAIYEPAIRNHQLCAPNKFYEALALAKPVIVCRGTGIDKIVDSNNIGIVIDYDAEQFYSAIRYLKDNPIERAVMGYNGRKLYEKIYSWTVMRTRILNIYKEF